MLELLKAKLELLKAKFEFFKANLKLKIQQNRCYNANEAVGRAVFGLCDGHYNSKDKTPTETCSICPYFIENKQGGGDNG